MSLSTFNSISSLVNEFSYVAHLELDYSDPNGRIQTRNCSGTIVASMVILTAASCVLDNIESKLPIRIIGGKQNLYRENTNSEQMRKARVIIVDSKYIRLNESTDSTQHNLRRGRTYDYAVVILDQPFVFNNMVNKIKFAANNHTFQRSRVKSIEWTNERSKHYKNKIGDEWNMEKSGFYNKLNNEYCQSLLKKNSSYERDHPYICRKASKFNNENVVLNGSPLICTNDDSEETLCGVRIFTLNDDGKIIEYFLTPQHLRWISILLLFRTPSNQNNQIIQNGNDTSHKLPIHDSNRKKSEFSYVTLINITKHKDELCLGTIVSPKLILTAAHCVFGHDPSTIEVIGGRKDIWKGNEVNENEQIRNVSKIVFHPQYKHFNASREYSDFEFKNEIAAIVLIEPFDLNEYVNSIPFAKPFESVENSSFAAKITWKNLRVNGLKKSELEKIRFMEYDAEYCKERFEREYGRRNYTISISQICGTDYLVTPGTAPWGTPLVCYGVQNQKSLCGMFSFRSFEPAGSVGYFVPVNKHFSWLQEIEKNFSITENLEEQTDKTSINTYALPYEIIFQNNPKLPSIFPYFANIEIIGYDEILIHNFYGTIVSPKLILTVAKYLMGQNISNIQIVAGKQNFKSKDSNEQRRGVEKIHFHPRLQLNSEASLIYPVLTNEIVVIVLDEPLIFNDQVNRIPMAIPNEKQIGDSVYWNSANIQWDSKYQRLEKYHFFKYNDENCEEILKKKNSLEVVNRCRSCQWHRYSNNLELEESQISQKCGELNRQNEKDYKISETGTPLVCNDSDQVFLCGINSFEIPLEITNRTTNTNYFLPIIPYWAWISEIAKNETTQALKKHETQNLLGSNLAIKESLYNCPNGKSIRNSSLCDGYNDCGNGEDESNCSSCTALQFKCKNKNCIPLTYICDKNKDCDDGGDEMGCSPCGIQDFKCKNGECLKNAENLICNSNTDCSDGSDELNCGFSNSDIEEIRRRVSQILYNVTSQIKSL